MPVVYSTRSNSQIAPAPSASTSALALTDADDSIVLSDLLRSGEASRLRRRGAIFIRDPSGPGSTSSSSSSSLPPAPARPPTSPTARRAPPLVALPAPGYPDDYDEDDEDDADEYAGPGWGFGPPGGAADSVDSTERDAARVDLESEMRLEDADQALGTFALYCGGPPEDVADDSPTHLRRKASAFIKPARRASTKRSNGCGALIHLAATPRRQLGVWVARGDAGEALAPLEAQYFDCRAVAKMLRSTCGCVREGVGCRHCGNPLGTIFTPCPPSAAGLFSLSPSPSPGPPISPPPFRVPRTARPASAPPATATPTSIFTFFAHNVQSVPEYAFPELPPTLPPTLTPSTSADQPLLRRRWPTYIAPRQWSVNLSDGEPNDNPDGEDSEEEETASEEGTVRDYSPNDSQEKIETMPLAAWAER